MSSVSIRDYSDCLRDEVFGKPAVYPVYKRKIKKTLYGREVDITVSYTTTKNGFRIIKKYNDEIDYRKEVTTHIHDGHIYKDVYKHYGEDRFEYNYKDGQLHREGFPAVREVRYDGIEHMFSYYNNGVLHNLDGPAIILEDSLDNTCYKSYYIYGKLHSKAEWSQKVFDIIRNGVKKEDVYSREQHLKELVNEINNIFAK
jgi:hypothetical protein